MEIEKSFLNGLLSEPDGQQKVDFYEDGVAYKLDFNKEKDKVTIVIEKDNNKEQFEKWLTDNVDDDIFQETYENFSKLYHMSMQDINNLYLNNSDKLISLFKPLVKQTAINKINKLAKQYNVPIRNCQSDK